MNSNLYFRSNPVEVRVSSPYLGFFFISLVSVDEFEKSYLELTVQDSFDHVFEVVKELLDLYES